VARPVSRMATDDSASESLDRLHEGIVILPINQMKNIAILIWKLVH
jgi:hypothetical protein